MLVHLAPYILAFAVSCSVGLYTWKQRGLPVALPFALFILLEALYTLGYIFELVATGETAKLFWDNVQLITIYGAPLAFLAFALRYTNRRPPHPTRTWLLLAIIPAAGLVLGFTNDWHHILRDNIRINTGDPFTQLRYTFTPAFTFFGLYALLITFSGIALFVNELSRTASYYRPRLLVIIFGLLVPFLGTALVLVRIRIFKETESIPITFAISNVIVAWGLFHYRLLDVVPIARATLIESLRDAVFVVDPQNHLLDMNAAAQQLAGVPRDKALGQTASDLFPQWKDIPALYHDFAIEQQVEITVGEADHMRFFEVRLSPIHSVHNTILGRMIILRDITKRKRTEQELDNYHSNLEDLIQARTADVIATNEQLHTALSHHEHTQRALQLSEERYRRATHAGKVGVWEWDTRDQSLYIAPELKHMLGYTPDELSGNADMWTTLIDPRDQPQLMSTMTALLDGTSNDYAAELRLQHKHNGVRWMSMRGTVIRDHNDQPRRVLGTATDISESVRMMHVLQRRDAILQAVNHAADDLLRAVDWRDVVPRMLAELGRATNTDLAAIFRAYRDNEKTWHFEMGYHWKTDTISPLIADKNNASFLVRSDSDNTYTESWQRGDTVAFNVRDLPTNMQPELLEWNIESLLDVPIVLQNKLWGLISLHKCNEQHHWQPNEIEALQTAANILGTAMERQQAREALQGYANRLNILHELDQAILSAQSPEEIARSALLALQPIVPHTRSSVTRFDAKTGHAHVIMMHSEGDSQIITGHSIPLNEMIFSGDNVGKLRIIDNLDNADPENSIMQQLRAEGIVSVLNAPLLYKGNLLGTLNLGAATPGYFTSEYHEIVQQVAAQLAIAMHQADLREQIHDHAEQLEQRVAERTAELETANQHLQALTQIKDEFVSNVSHELRTPIANLKLYLDLLKLRPANVTRYADTLSRETNRLENLIEALLMLSRLDQERVTLKLKPVDLNALAREYHADRTSMANNHDLTLTFNPADDLPAALADYNLVGQVLSILLTNAFHYTGSTGQIAITTATTTQRDRVYAGFTVSDTGPGIAPDEKERLFARFFRGAAGRESGVSGTGLGLAIAKEIVNRHDGIIDVHSSGVPGEGTTFCVWLPVAPAESL